MASARPLFSIVMPTRNRAQFLHYSLQSALEQSFDNYEIVVSDNNSSDDTPQVVRELANGRVRYVRSDQPLSNPDSSEFALTHARGEYIIFLADYDAMCPDLLEKVAEVGMERQARVITWERAFYFHGRMSEPDHTNTLELCPFTQQVVDVDSESSLRRLYAADWNHGFPALVDAAYHCDVIKRVTARNTRFFYTIPLDISSCLAVLTQVDKYAYIRDSMVVYGKHDGNTVLSAYRPESNERQESDFAANRFEHVPLRSSLLLNYTFETLLKMKQVMPAELKEYEVDWAAYFMSCHDDLMILQEHGADVYPEIQEFFAALDRQPTEFQLWVRSAIVQLGVQKAAPSFRFRKWLERSSLLGQLELALRPSHRQSKNLRIRGDKVGFGNIVECARFLNHGLRKELARFWTGQRWSLPVEAEVLSENPWRVV